MRVISFSDESESKEYQCQKLMYQAFISEMREMVAPVEASLDATRLGSSFCSSCDPRVSLLLSKPLGNDSLLDRQLCFEPVTDPKTGTVTHGNSDKRVQRKYFTLALCLTQNINLTIILTVAVTLHLTIDLI